MSDQRDLFSAVFAGDLEKVREAFAPKKGVLFGKRDAKIDLTEKTREVAGIGSAPGRSFWQPMTVGMVAATQGHIHILQFLFDEKGLDPSEQKNDAGQTALMLAAWYGQVETMKYLMEEKKRSIKFQDEKGWNPLFWAVNGGQLAVVQFICEHPKGKLTIDAVDKNGETALAMACTKTEKQEYAGSANERIMQYLVEHAHADINKQEKDGFTPIMRAAYHKVPTQYLVDHGADPRAKNQSNVNALMASVTIAPYKKSTFKYLLDELQIDPNQRTTANRTVLSYAVEAGLFLAVKYLIEDKQMDPNEEDANGVSLLTYSLKNDSAKVAKYLIERGAAWWKEGEDPITTSNRISRVPFPNHCVVFELLNVTELIETKQAEAKKAQKKKAKADKAAKAAAEATESGTAVAVTSEETAVPPPPPVEAEVSPVPVATKAVEDKGPDLLDACHWLPAPLGRMLSQYLLNEAEAALATARSSRNMDKVKSHLSSKRLLEEKIASLPAAVLAAALPEDMSCQAVGTAMDKYLEDLYSTAESDEELAFVEKVEEVCVQLRASSAPSSVKTEDACIITDRLLDGKQSSGLCMVVDGVYSTALFHDRQVKIKLRKRDQLHAAEHEYRMMHSLYESNSRRFVKPYALIKGWENTVLQSGEQEMSGYCGIVMEKGIESLDDYFRRKSDLTRLELLAFAENILDIVIAAHKTGIVLMDLKPANIIRCLNEDNEIILKAVDFDSTRRIGEGIDGSITAQYGSYEVARYALQGGKEGGAQVLGASTAMDIASFAWIVWKMCAERTLWDQLGLIQEADILNKLSSLQDSEIKKHIEVTFPGAVLAPLRHWLEAALKVDPLSRPSASSLKFNYSLFGHKESTINMESLAQRIVTDVDVKLTQHTEIITRTLVDRIDELSQEMKEQFASMHHALEAEAMQMVCGGKSEQFEQLFAFLDQQRNQATQGQLDSAQLLVEMQKMNADLHASFTQTIATALTKSDAQCSQSDKLDAVLEMMTDMKQQMTEIHSLAQGQLSLLMEMNKAQVPLPHMFCIVPEVKRQKLDKQASSGKKALNFIMRCTEMAHSALWTRSRLIFICPVTLTMVPCGSDGKGYLIELPTVFVQKAAPIIKTGFLLLKVALSTQGLGAVVPNMTDFLPAVNLDMMNSLLSEVSSLATDKATDAVQSAGEALSNGLEADVANLRTLLALVAKEEGVADPAGDWKPSKTGLVWTTCKKTGDMAWVSPSAQPAFQKLGQVAFGEVVQE